MTTLRKQRLFEYVVLWHPTDKQFDDGQRSKTIVQKKETMQSDDKTVAILANREIPETYLDQLDQVEVIVRPF